MHRHLIWLAVALLATPLGGAQGSSGSALRMQSQPIGSNLPEGSLSAAVTITGQGKPSQDGIAATTDGSAETFYAEFEADGKNTDGSTHVSGWDAELNVALLQGHVVPATANLPMGLAVRMSTVHPTTLMAQSILYFGGAAAPNNSDCVGFNNAEPGSLSKSQGQRFAVCLGRNSAYLLNGNITTPLNFPNAAAFVTVTFWLSASGDLNVSMVQVGTNGAVTNDLAGVTPPPNLTNFEISGESANDQQYGSRYAVSGRNEPGPIEMAYDGGVHPGGASVLTSTTAGGVFALIPPNYNPGAANRAVIYLHGLQEAGWSVSCQAPYAGCNQGVALVALGLMNAGYVVIGVNGSDKACYGNVTCMAELRNVVDEYQTKLSLTGGLYGFADSMGGFQLLNAISQGVFAPRAMAGCCLNTNLADDYFVNYTAPGSATPAVQAGTATPLIDRAYLVTSTNAYADATDGFDPLLATGAALARLVSVPAMFWASHTDQQVNRTYNSDQYAAMVNAAGGSVTVITCTGGHEDPSCFHPADVVGFFDKH